MLRDEGFWIIGEGIRIRHSKDAWIYNGSNTRIEIQLNILVASEVKVESFLSTEASQ